MSSQRQQQPSRAPSSSRSTRVQEPVPAHTELDRYCADSRAWPLHYAAQTGDFGEIRNLLQQQPLPPSRRSQYSRPRSLQGPKSVDIHARDPYGFTALHYAVRKQNRTITKYLLEFPGGSLTEIQDNIGQSALHWAAQLCLVDIVGLLCDANACVTAEDKLGWTPLHHLCSSNLARGGKHESAVRSIIKRLIRSAHGKDIWKSQDKRGRMPVHIAAAYGVSINQLLGLDSKCANDKDLQQQYSAALHKQSEIKRESKHTVDVTKAKRGKFSQTPDHRQLRHGSGQLFNENSFAFPETMCYEKLCSIIKSKHLFPSNDAKLKEYVQTHSNVRTRFWKAVAPHEVPSVTMLWEFLFDLGALTLYDHTVIVDDSASMNSKVASGDIVNNIDWMNGIINGSTGPRQQNVYHANTPASDSSGISTIGSCLWNEIVKPLLDGQKKLVRPLVITIITDGEVDPMEASLLERAMLQATRKMQELKAPGALVFQFVNVGKPSAEPNGGDGHGVLRAITRQSELARYVDIVDWLQYEWNVPNTSGTSSSGGYSSLDNPQVRNMARMFLGPIMKPYRELIHDRRENQSIHDWMEN